MKSKLHLYFVSCLAAFSLVPSFLSAQNNVVNQQAIPWPCPTCVAGTHGLMVNAPNHAQILNNNNNQMVQSHNRIGNGNGSLSQSFIWQNSCGLNYVQFSQLTETRTKQYNFNDSGSGFPAKLNFNNIPCGGFGGVIKAIAYWSASYTEGSPPTATITITNPVNVVNTFTSVIIGTGGSTCWPTNGTANYRADITPAINGPGAYNMALNGFANVGYEVAGITAIIVYKDPSGTYTGTFSIWDGCVVLIGGTYNFTSPAGNFTACAASTNGNAFIMASDMQDNVNANRNDEDWNGSTGIFANTFWNSNTISTNVTNGQNTCLYKDYTNNGGDCWALVGHGLYYQNTTCQVCQQQSQLQVSMTFQNPTCNDSNGFATVHVSGGVKPYTYSWSPVGGTDSTAINLKGGTYTVTVKTPCGDTNLQVILIGNTLAYTNTSQNVSCFGGEDGSAAVHITGGTPPYTYSWSPVANFTNAVNGLSAGQYIVNVNDNAGCFLNDTFNITQPPLLTTTINTIHELCYQGTNASVTGIPAGGTPPYQYNWTNGPRTPIDSGLPIGTYTLTVTDSHFCTATATATITQPTLLISNIIGPTILCVDQPGTLTALGGGGTPPYNYLWDNNAQTSAINIKPLAKTTYSVIVTDANGCSTNSSWTVSLGLPIYLTVNGPQTTCPGIPVSLCGNATGGNGPDSYNWQPGNLNGNCVQVAPTVSTTYTLEVTDTCDGRDTASVFVYVEPSPQVDLGADAQQGCAPLCVHFHDYSEVPNGNISSWAWNFGNGDTSREQNPIFCYSKPGNFTINLSVVSDHGCSSSLNILNMINVFSHPNAKFDITPTTTTILNPDIQFTDKSTDKYGIVYWFWNFGDSHSTGQGNVSNAESPSHTYSDTGTFCAQLSVINSEGCVDTTTDCLVIDPVFNLYIPSAFSPNSINGLNQVFEAKGSYIKSFEMYIFDRWGMQLFHSNDINDGWNGTVDGGSRIVQNDSYVYQIYVTDTRNKSHNYVGQITLMR